MNLSKNFTLEELIYSPTAKRLKIDNTPSKYVISSLKKLCENVLQPLRDKYEKPIIVTSGYRSSRLNKAVGGSSTSDHVYGRAADIRTVDDNNKILWDLLLDMVQKGEIYVKQVIDEFGYDWIHVSFQEGNKKNQFLRSFRKGNRTIYV